jgi:probable rRNA maturation factor
MGDIVLSFTTIAKEVENLSATGSDKDVLFYQYVYYLFVHGFLHLLGYTHDTKKPREHMEMLETAALNKLGIDARRFR